MHPRSASLSSSSLLILALSACPDSDPPGATGVLDTGGTDESTEGSTGAGPSTQTESTGAPDPSASTESSTAGASESTTGGFESESGSTTGDESESSSTTTALDTTDTVEDTLGDTEGDTEGEIDSNLVSNPDFEINTAGWTTWGTATIAISNAQAHSGTYSGIIANRTDTWQSAVYSLLGAVEGGEQYDVSFWARLANATSDVGRLTVQSTCDGESATYTQLSSATLGDGSWTHLVGVLTVPTCTLTALNVYVEGPAADVAFYIDDVSVILRPPPVNVLTNSDFEIDASGWFGWGAITVSATADRAHGGLQSGVATGRTSSWQGPATSLLGLVTPGTVYQAHAWVSIGGAEAATTSLTVASTCEGADQTYTQLGSVVASEAEWTQVGGTLNVPNCNLTGITLYVEGPAAEVDVYLDDVSVAQ